MEKRLKNYIDENVEDLKTQLDQLHDRFVTDTANGKVTMRFLGQSITNTEKDIKEHFIGMLGTVEQRMQKIQKEINQDLEAVIEERLNANKKRSACAAFGGIDDTQRLTDAQRPYPGARGSEMNLESHQIGYNYPFMEFGKRFEIQLNNVQTHLESAVSEMKSGTYKRLAGLDERVGAMEETMDKIILLMEKMEAYNADKRVVS
ncbi:hypothetical protein A0O28_0022290 [Trichoderma guizhouense]|uniref:Uncharacterized protein n=1 Tax=Trichoderma guizhouense TaxID=1491466 RepID=A0A1T3CS45_9HYPO|nr:hypothetical protein A0O28_0022290 [Trichoderma guizhouense]